MQVITRYLSRNMVLSTVFILILIGSNGMERMVVSKSQLYLFSVPVIVLVNDYYNQRLIKSRKYYLYNIIAFASALQSLNLNSVSKKTIYLNAIMKDDEIMKGEIVDMTQRQLFPELHSRKYDYLQYFARLLLTHKLILN